MAETQQIEPKKISEYLKYEFTTEERLVLADELGRANRNLDALKLRKAEVTKRIGSEIAEAESTVNGLSNKVVDGYEYRNIDCEVRFDVPRRGMKTIVRLDTSEIVAEKRMSDEENQMVLKFEQENQGAQEDE